MPAGETYIKLRSTTLSSTASTVNFTGIPQTYTDLILVVNGGMNTTTGYATAVRLNGDSSNAYSSTYILGNGSITQSGRYTNSSAMYVGGPATNTLNSTIILQFQNYSNMTTNKTVLVRSSRAANDVWAVVGLWRNNSAITQIEISPEFTASWLSGSTFTLYGIAASVAPQASGGTITTDGTNWIHTFTSSGVFTPINGLNDVDYLVIAGGGGGGRADVNNNGGGGGAGGYRTSAGTSGGGAAAQSRLSLSANTSYVVTVGAGGSGGASDYTGGSNGGSSSFLTVSTTGGGGGGAVNSPGGGGRGRDGGSGGGSGDFNNNWTGGLGTANEGFDGGSGVGAAGTSRNMGGGGGAGGAGQSYVTQTGGIGVASTITGTSVTRAVGGNGSGSGGGGGANTGNGGNGSRNTGNGGNGGSGIVVIRYPR